MNQLTLHSGRTRDAAAPVFFSALAAFVWLICLSLFGPVGYIAPIMFLAAGGVLWFTACAAAGHSWALASMLGFALVVPNIYFQHQELHEAASLNAQNGLKLLLWAIMGLVGLAGVQHSSAILKDRAILAITLFSIVAIASIMWSPTPAYTAVGSFGFLATILFSCSVAARLPEATIHRTVVVSFVLYAMLNLVTAALLPDIAWLSTFTEADAPRLQGISSHPNILGKEMATFICLLFPLGRAYGSKRMAYIFLTLAFVMILATRSRTSLVAVAFPLALPIILRPQVARPLAWIAATATGAAMLAIAVGFTPDVQALLDGASRSSDASEILTLTGRTELWSFVWTKILEAPILGHGFGSADAVLSPQWWGAPDASVGAHNTWLQSLLIVGVVGTIPFAYFHAQLIKRWFSEPESLTRLITPYLLIQAMTEVEIAAHPIMLTVAVFLLTAMDAQRKQKSAIA